MVTEKKHATPLFVLSSGDKMAMDIGKSKIKNETYGRV